MTKVLLGLVFLAGAASTGCATASAKTTPDRPTLEVPAPPAKVVETTPQPETMPELVPDLPPEKPANTRTSKPPALREPARMDPKPEPPATPETPSAPAASVTPAPQLRPAGTDPEAAKQVQAMIQKAEQAITAVNCSSLLAPRKTVCENAILTLKQAKEALTKSDFENAKKLAQKVDDTAKELQR